MSELQGSPVPSPSTRWSGPLPRAVLVVVVLAHLAALYWPTVGVQGPVVWTDKVVHVLLFGVPTAVGVLVGLRRRVVVTLMVLHAPVSELVQGYLLPHRSGDVWDAVADLAGVVVGVTVVVVGRRLRRC